MLSYNELRRGTVFVFNGEPHQVLEYEFLRMQQRKPVAKTKLRNLINGKVFEQTFHQSDSFEEAEIEKRPTKFIYSSRGEFWFCPPNDPKGRFQLPQEVIGDSAQYLKPNSEITALVFDDKIIGIDLPIKMDFEVIETSPNIKGNTAQGGTKPATLETGAKVNVPLFINTGDIIRVNTQTGEYVERAEKV